MLMESRRQGSNSPQSAFIYKELAVLWESASDYLRIGEEGFFFILL